MENLKQESSPEIGEALASSLAKLGIDPAFVTALEHRPNQQLELELLQESIPVIDLAGDELQVIQQVEDSSREWGFFQVINHGVPVELLSDLEVQAREFFSLPLEEKLRIRRSTRNPLGYYESEHTKNTRDWKEVFDFCPRGPAHFPEFNLVFENHWPEGREQFRKACGSWASEVDKLSFRILELLALSLGLPAKHFHQFFFEGDNTSLMRLNFYAQCPIPDLVLGVSRHKDRGALTVLVQDDVGGLEVRRKDGEWIRVKPRKDAFVINVGDLMQVWSNDLYHSVEHRVVVNENRDRFSCPYFMFPSYKSTIEPVKSLTSEGNKPKYSAFNWGEFDKIRKDGNLKRLGVENLQIHHYKIY